MQLDIYKEAGYEEALLGMMLSFGKTSHFNTIEEFTASDTFTRAKDLSVKLSQMSGGHNGFLEMIDIWISIDAPRYWWSHMDRYRPGKSQLSESTMHTLTKSSLDQEDFENPIPFEILNCLNDLIEDGDVVEAKDALPEAFLQRRIVKLNYMNLRNIVAQRKTHKLPVWRQFVEYIYHNVQHPEFLPVNEFSSKLTVREEDIRLKALKKLNKEEKKVMGLYYGVKL